MAFMTSVSPMPSRRLACIACLRPQNACICHWITPVAHPVEVLILQHPLEVGNPKGSARLLHLSLPGSRLVTGEVFDLPGLLGAPPAADFRHCILLYPDTPPGQPGKLAPPRLDPAWLQEPAQLRLVVLDGTWRKSRKMLHRNPLLQQLPRLALQDTGASRYRIRKAHRPDQLSTLEATCAALARLHGGIGPLQPLLVAFDGFVTQQFARQSRSAVPRTRVAE